MEHCAHESFTVNNGGGGVGGEGVMCISIRHG